MIALVLRCIAYFASSMLGTMLGWKLSAAVDRARRAHVKALKSYVKSLEAGSKVGDRLIAALKEQNAAQSALIRHMGGAHLFEKKPDPPTVN